MEEEKKEEQASEEENKSENEIDQEELAKSWEEALKEQEELSKASAEKAEAEASGGGNSSAETELKLDLQSILEIPLSVEVIIGEAEMPLKDVLDLNPGAIVELNREISDPVDIKVNGKLVARGEIVTIGENFGVRIKEIYGKERKDVIGASVNKNI